MSRPRITRVRTFAALAAVGLLTACGGQALGNSSGGGGGSSDAPIKVGLLVAQSGVYSSVGRDMENGIRLYLKEHDNKIGGHEIDLVTVDEGETPQSGVAGATRLVQQDQVDVVLGITAGPTAMGSRDVLDSAQVPTLLGNTGAVALGGDAASDWIWRASYDNGDPGRALGAFMAKDASAGNFFLIAADYSGGHETVEGFKQTLPADRIAGELYTPFGTTTDYSSYLSQIRSSGAKNVFCFYAGAEAIEFTKQFAQFGLSDSVHLYSAGFLTEGSALEAEGNAALGVQNATRYNWDIDTPENKKFEPAYEKEYGKVPTVYAATMYDVGIILDAAVSSIHGDVTRQSINDAMAGVKVDGARGELSFDDTNTIQQQHYLTKVESTDKGLRNVTQQALPKP